MPPFAKRARPLLFAHRGASLHAPENTLEAFDLAVRLSGADVLELDVHTSLDGEVVVLHDATVDRTTNGFGPVRLKTYKELSDLDAGARFVSPHGAAPFADRNVVIPRLRDVLRAFPKHAFNIEVKQADPPMLKALFAVLEAAGPRDVLLTAGVHAIMQTLEAAQPGCALGLSSKQALRVVRGCYGGPPLPEAWRGRALQIPPWHRGFPVATKRLIRYAQHAGLDVHVWTLNHPAKARKYLLRGVDGIMSDDPGALTEVMQAARRTP